MREASVKTEVDDLINQVCNWTLLLNLNIDPGNMSSDYEPIVIRFNPASLFQCPILGDVEILLTDHALN